MTVASAGPPLAAASTLTGSTWESEPIRAALSAIICPCSPSAATAIATFFDGGTLCRLRASRMPVTNS
jgi:hypothetical protein